MHRFSVLTACSTFFLLIAGALVTSTGSGLAVPDWPLSYGQIFPPMVGGILYEHSHRMIAAGVATLMLALAVWAWRAETRRSVRALAWVAFGSVIAQAILGGLTVLYLLPAPISVAHACLGQTFFCMVVTIALLTSRSWNENRGLELPGPVTGRIRWAGALCTAALYLQLALGASLRHGALGLTAHLAGAGLAAAACLTVLGLSLNHLPREPLFMRPAGWLAGLATAQGILGSLAAWTGPSVWIPTAHVAAGALLLATSLVFTLRSFQHLA